MKFKVVRTDYVERCGECPYCQDLMTGVGCAHPSREYPDPFFHKISNFTSDEGFFPEDCPLVLAGEQVE